MIAVSMQCVCFQRKTKNREDLEEKNLMDIHTIDFMYVPTTSLEVI